MSKVIIQDGKRINIRPIPGYPGYYASRGGKIYSDKRGTIKPMMPSTSNKGRYRVLIRVEVNGKISRYQPGVSRLIALTYCPNPDNKPFVLHNDNNPLNNRASNLRWGTQSENIKQAYDDGRARSPYSGQIPQTILDSIDKLYNEGYFNTRGSFVAAGKLLSVSRLVVSRRVNKLRANEKD